MGDWVDPASVAETYSAAVDPADMEWVDAVADKNLAETGAVAEDKGCLWRGPGDMG